MRKNETFVCVPFLIIIGYISTHTIQSTASGGFYALDSIGLDAIVTAADSHVQYACTTHMLVNIVKLCIRYHDVQTFITRIHIQ